MARISWITHSSVVRVAVLVAVLSLSAASCSVEDAATDSSEPPPPTTDLSRDAAPAAVASEPYLYRPVNREAPPFTLIDQNDEVVSLSDFAGKWVLIDWVFTECVSFCPLLTGEMIRVRNGMEDAIGNEVQLVTITFDPERDTPETLQSSALFAGAGPGWSWLTGTEEETDAVAASYGVSFDPAEPVAGVAQFDHTSLMVMIGPDGRERHRYLGVGWSREVIDRLEAEMASLQPAEPNVVFAEPAPVSAPVAELLSAAIALPWEDWELEADVSSQVLYQFPTSGAMVAYVDEVSLEAASLGIEVNRQALSAMTARLFDWSDGRATGIGYTNNLAVVVEGTSTKAVLDALSVLDEEWCCGTAGA